MAEVVPVQCGLGEGTCLYYDMASLLHCLQWARVCLTATAAVYE